MTVKKTLAIVKYSLIQKRRNIVVTLCEYLSHLIILLFLIYGYFVSKVEIYPATIYSTINISIPPPWLKEYNDTVIINNSTITNSSSLNDYLYIDPVELVTSLTEDLNGPVMIPSLQLFLIANQLISNNSRNVNNYQNSYGTSETFTKLQNLLYKGIFHFTPNNELTHDLIDYISNTTSLFSTYEYYIHENEDAAINYIIKTNLDSDLQNFCLIVLREVTLEKVNYVIRMNYTVLPATDYLVDSFTLGLNTEYQKYITSGYLSVQNTVDNWVFNYTRSLANNRNNYSVNSDPYCMAPVTSSSSMYIPFPTYEYSANPFYMQVGFLIGLALTMTILYPVSRLVKTLVEEKECKMRELMSIHGMSAYCYNSGHYIVALFTFLWIAFTMAIFSKLFFVASNIVLLFIYYFLFVLSVVHFSFILVSFFNNSKLAAIVAPVVLFVGVLPRYVFFGYGSNTGVLPKIFASFLSPTAFALGCDIITNFEYIGSGIQPSNSGTGRYSFNTCLFMLVVDNLLYWFLGFYLDRVYYRDYGRSLHPLFFIFPSYWYSFFVTKGPNSDSNNHPMALNNGDVVNNNVEPFSDAQKENISILLQNLTKKYDDGKVAVNDLSLQLLHGEISVLLGPNGSGKTTLTMILTGMTTATSGSFHIYNNNNIENIRRFTSYVPQSNILFPLLTVRENLQFFAVIKGVQDLYNEVNMVINEVDLLDKQHVLASCLSGGMKRRLQLAIALLGNPKLLIVDEASSGIDPKNRRFLWNVLLKRKSSITTLLTTHYLFEAESIGDRIIIMNEGKILSSGSLIYLQQTVGSGYVMTLSKESKLCNESNVIQFVMTLLPGIVLHSINGSEIIFTVHVRYDIGLFPQFFKSLIANKRELRVGSFNISLSSLEFIFVKLIKSINEGNNNADYIPSLSPSNIPVVSSNDTARSIEMVEYQLVPAHTNCDYIDDNSSNNNHNSYNIATSDIEGIPSIDDVADTSVNTYRNNATIQVYRGKYVEQCQMHLLQFKLLFYKRILLMIRDKKGFFFQVLFPALQILLILAILTISINPAGPTLVLNTSSYQDDTKIDPILFPYTYLYNNQYNWFNDSLSNTTIGEVNKHMGGKMHLKDISGNVSSSEEMSSFLLYDKTKDPNAIGTTFGAYGFNDSITANVTIDWDFVERYLPYCLADVNCKALLPDEVQNVVDIINLLNGFGVLIFNNSEVGTSHYTANVSSDYTIFHNSSSPHAFAIFGAELNSAAQRQCINKTIDSNNIVAANLKYLSKNHPLPITYQQSLEIKLVLSILTSLFLIVPLCYIPASFITILVKEKANKVKHLQLISGVNAKLYWISNYIFDLVLFTILNLLILFAMLVYSKDASIAYVSTVESAFCVLISLILYSMSVLPLSYIYSFRFDNPSTALISVATINFFTGFVALLAYYIMLNIPLTHNAAIRVRYFFLFFPSYEIGECLLDISTNYYINNVFDANRSYFSWNVAGKNLTFMAVEAIGYFALTLFIETNDFSFHYHDTSHIKQSSDNHDAINEANRVELILQNENEANNYNVITHQLTKIYNYNFVAVKKLSLAIKKGEIFGLLGKNGSGKSTLCGTLTCEKKATSGMISICGHSLDNDETKLSIGYCPQTDTIFESLTVLETLTFYGNIRMIPKDVLHTRIHALIEKLKLAKFTNIISGNLSGGNKRKLSLAISLIGNPKLLCIDECSSGMDSYAMRSMWQCISSLVQEDNSLSIIITTHSMEEAEALCNRIGILKNGEFVCIGTVQELKDKYELGYIIDITMTQSSTELVHHSTILSQSINEIFANIIVLEVRPLSLKLQLTGNGDEIISHLSALLEFLEKKKDEYSIISYSVNQVNFEEVFNKASE